MYQPVSPAWYFLEARVHSTSRSLPKTLNRPYYRILQYPTCYWPPRSVWTDFYPSGCPPIHTVTSQLGYKCIVRDCTESLAKVTTDRYCSSFIHKPIMESNQAGQAWSSLGKSMLTASSPPLLLHVPKNMFQEDSLHDFSKSSLELSSLWFHRCIYLSKEWVFAFHCYGLPVLSVTLQWYFPQHPQMQPIWLYGLVWV